MATTTGDPDIAAFQPRLNVWAMIKNLLNNNVALLPGSGAPTNGTSGTGAGFAAPSSIYFDYTNGALYYNNGTLLSPVWSAVSLDDITGDVTIAAGISTIGAGKVRPTMQGLAVINKSGSSIPADSLVSFIAGDATTGLPSIVLANAATAGHEEVFVTVQAIANNAQGVVYGGALSAANLNTNSFSAAGAIVYLSDATPGGFTQTAPTAATSRVQPVGIVQVKSATVGQILWNPEPINSWGTNEIQALAITTGLLAAASVTDAKLDVGTIKTATLAITNAQAKALRATPLTVVAAPGVGKMILPISASIELIYGGTNAFTSAANDVLGLKWKDGTTTSLMTGFVQALAQGVASAFGVFLGLTASNVTKANTDNQALVVHNITASELAGNAANDNTLNLVVKYTIQPTV